MTTVCAKGRPSAWPPDLGEQLARRGHEDQVADGQRLHLGGEGLALGRGLAAGRVVGGRLGGHQEFEGTEAIRTGRPAGLGEARAAKTLSANSWPIFCVCDGSPNRASLGLIFARRGDVDDHGRPGFLFQLADEVPG